MTNQEISQSSEPSILIVDDNSQNLQVLGKILQENNYEIEFAINGEAALVWLKKRKFDLILLDINMPVMDGFEVCRKVRSNPELNNVPVIFLSAESEKESILKGFELGAQDYITKPFDSRELLTRVRTHLALKNSLEKLDNQNQILDEKVKERTFELYEAYKKLEIANEELQSLDLAKTEFLQIISHEINTPLNGIIGFTGILKESLKNSEFSDALSYLDISAKRLSRFSRVALLITQLNTKSRSHTWEDVPVAELEEFVTKKLKDKLQPRGILLSFRKDSNLSIFGERELLQICFESILGNAVRYSFDEGLIIVNCYLRNGATVCEFVDEGKGFNKEALKNIFKLFKPGEKHIDQNIGLDLALVKLIMDTHQGTILIKNNETKGATVQLNFRDRKGVRP